MYADSMLTGEDNFEFEADIGENWDKYIKLPSRFEIEIYLGSSGRKESGYPRAGNSGTGGIPQI